MLEVMSETSFFSSKSRRHTIGWPTNLRHNAWLCISQIILNINVLFDLWYSCNIKGHPLFFCSSVFTFQLSDKFFILTTSFACHCNKCLSSIKPKFDLLIIMSDSNLAASTRIQYSVCSRKINSWSLINLFLTPTYTTLCWGHFRSLCLDALPLFTVHHTYNQ